jgi:hypothetical protein
MQPFALLYHLNDITHNPIKQAKWKTLSQNPKKEF